MTKILILIGVISLNIPSVYAREHSAHSHGSFRQWNFEREIADLHHSEEREFRRSHEMEYRKVWANDRVESVSILFHTAQGFNPSEKQVFYQYYHLGFQDMNQKNYAQAVVDFTNAIEIKPQMNAVYYFRAIAYSRKNEFSKALDDVNKADELGYAVNPIFNDFLNKNATRQAAEVYYSLGFNDMHQEKFTQAIADFTKALEIDPTYKMIYYCRGVVYLRMDEFNKALTDINIAKKKGVLISPVLINEIEQHQSIGQGGDYSSPDNFPQLIADFTQAIKANPKDPDLYVKRGLCYKKQHNYVQAIADYTQAIEIDPKFADAYRRRGSSYYNLKEYDKSWADEIKAQELGVIVNAGLIRALKKELGKEYFPGEDETKNL